MTPEAPQPEQSPNSSVPIDAAADNAAKAAAAREIIQGSEATEPLIEMPPEPAPAAATEITPAPQMVEPMPGTLPAMPEATPEATPEAVPAPPLITEVPPAAETPVTTDETIV